MKYSLKLITLLLALTGMWLASCKKQLTEEVYSQLVPQNFLTTEDGIKSVLKAAYTHEANVRNQSATKGFIMAQEMVGDIMWETGGADNRQALQFINFTWDAGLDWIFGMFWNPMYLAIRDANSVLDNLDAANISETRKAGYAAEARFIRAVCYYQLYLHFGPVPLRTTTLGTELGLAKSTDEEIRNFIESELTAIVSALPNPGSQEEYGRAHKGAALAFLCKFYLNTKQWQKCADAAKQVTNLNAYALNPSYTAMFRVENERNKEYIWVRPAAPSAVSGPGNDWCAYVFPLGFQSDPVTGITFQSNLRNYAAQYRLYDAFYNSFAANDVRRTMIITSYVNSSGQRLSLLNNNDTRPMKFWPDPASIEGGGGNDIPQIRYADILMSRAEALNELNGVNAESISLINEIRVRAGVTPVMMSDFGSPTALREHIIRERGWEFYCEGLRRQDLVRTGKLITYALARGAANAKPHHVVFPIPQQALDSDPLLKQNTGY